jgi:hypothetical protein
MKQRMTFSVINGRRGPHSCEGLMPQYRKRPHGQHPGVCSLLNRGRGEVLKGKPGERGLLKGKPGKEIAFENVNKETI